MTKKLLIIIPAALIILTLALYAFVNYQVKSIVDLRITEMLENKEYLTLEYGALNVELNGNIAMDNLHVVDNDNNDFILDGIRITDFDYFNSIPHYIDITVKDVRFPSGLPASGNSPDNPLNAYLGNIISDDILPLELNYRYDYQPEENSRVDSVFTLNLPNSFTLTSTWLLENVSMEALSGNNATSTDNPTDTTALIQNVDIPSALIVLEDAGIVDAMLNIQAEPLGISSTEYRQQLLAQLQTAALFIPQQLQPIARDFMSNFSEFLEGERTFQLAITPEFGGNIQQLQGEIMGAFFIGDFARIIELLNLEIETLPAD